MVREAEGGGKATAGRRGQSHGAARARAGGCDGRLMAGRPALAPAPPSAASGRWIGGRRAPKSSSCTEACPLYGGYSMAGGGDSTYKGPLVSLVKPVQTIVSR
jgi:hypothetical protein